MEKLDFFASIEHVSGNLKSRPEHRVHANGEYVFRSGSPLGALICLFNGMVEMIPAAGPPVRIERRHADADPETPFLGAHAYFGGGRVRYDIRAIGTVETVAFDTPFLHRLGRERAVVPLIRDLTRSSDLGPELARRFRDHFVRTRIPGFDPAAPHLLLSYQPSRYDGEYRLLAQQLFEELTKRRMHGSPTKTTRMVPLARPA